MPLGVTWAILSLLAVALQLLGACDALFSRFLRVYVRERQVISLREALAKTSLIPARILEQSVPQMRRKGRIAQGMDADLVVFDLATIADRATYEKPAQTSTGIRHVIVAGVPVIENGTLDPNSRPGRPVRRTTLDQPRPGGETPRLGQAGRRAQLIRMRLSAIQR